MTASSSSAPARCVESEPANRLQQDRLSAVRPRGRCRRVAAAIVACTALLSSAVVGRAQDMEPRAYSPAPIGTNFLVGGYAYTSGDVSLSPSIPITGVKAAID